MPVALWSLSGSVLLRLMFRNGCIAALLNRESAGQLPPATCA